MRLMHREPAGYVRHPPHRRPHDGPKRDRERHSILNQLGYAEKNTDYVQTIGMISIENANLEIAPSGISPTRPAAVGPFGPAGC